ncbi:MAG: NAD(P)/FAD-dependent oxidoreductase, partial [Thermoproteus sp.]|nr:NAD(P)/FAD-dependent oxidoreductase [Thermoproteus sp.]
RMRLALARKAYDLMYGRRFVDKALEILSGEEFVAIDYDDHIKTLAFALATTARGVRALAEALRYLIGTGGDRHPL